ncbi:unnamed protein product [Euphydryas editha]|uniref:BESS domain-containing protein n=1 Tax=Euphydryas editha TaxID=104508 RepID=A0AAU9U3C6_EUPED|nr:unnamed protein product [Euphydryas editha]
MIKEATISAQRVVKKIKNRWCNLRGSFMKELRKQKKDNMKREAGHLVKRRKRYEYFDNMLFLKDTINGGDETRDSDDSADPYDSSYQPEAISDYGESSSDVKNVHTRNNTLEEKVLDMLKVIKEDEDDEDRQFILSLVPTLRNLNEKQKLTARIEILEVLQNISFEQN